MCVCVSVCVCVCVCELNLFWIPLAVTFSSVCVFVRVKVVSDSTYESKKLETYSYLRTKKI